MYCLTMTPATLVTVQPVTEPITIHEAKRQLSLSPSDTSHDVMIYQKIQSAREQWEKDVGEYYIKRTVAVQLDMLTDVQFMHRPVSSISSVVYYDASNTLQTLSTSIYQLDAARGQMRLKYDQSWPIYTTRWDAVTITYILGSHDDSTTVPAYAKSAMLLLVANEFEQRDMMTPAYTQNQIAYERLVAKYMRSSYP